MNKLNILKLNKSLKILLIIGIIFIIGGLLGGGIFCYFIANQKTPNLSQVDKPGVISTVDVQLVTDYFATLTTNFNQEKYYFITDENNTYIAKLDEKAFAKLKANYTYNYSTDPNAIAPDAVTIFGKSEKIPADIQNFAIKYFQETEGIDLNSENFSDIIYPFLLNSNITKSEILINNSIIFGLITILGLVTLMIYANMQSKSKKFLAKYSNSLNEIAKELTASETKFYKILKTYVTDNYLINYQFNIKIIALADIVWIYPYEYRQSGIVISRSIVIVTKDGKKYFISKIKIWNKKKEENYNNLYQELLKKTPTALHGYSKNNKEESQYLINKSKLNNK